MVLAMDLALTMKLPALCHLPICSKQCRRLYHGDDTAVFLPNNFLSSFVAECVVYSYDELIRDRQSCFEEEKRRYIFSNIFLFKAKPVLCDIVLIISIFCYWYMKSNSKSSDTRSLMAKCQKYQEVPIFKPKASPTSHVCELWNWDFLSKFNSHYEIRPRRVCGCPLNGPFYQNWHCYS